MFEVPILIYLTGNRFKFEVAQQALRGLDLVLEQDRRNVPEIQSNSVQEIAEFSAQWASPQIDQPFIVTDSGFYIDALNGFPGPFIKYVNQWFSVEDLLRLMHNKAYRHIAVNDCLVYVRPISSTDEPTDKPTDESLDETLKKPTVSFRGSFKGKIATVPGQNNGTPIERLFIPDGYDVPISEFSPEEQYNYWRSGEVWHHFRTFYTNQPQPDHA